MDPHRLTLGVRCVAAHLISRLDEPVASSRDGPQGHTRLNQRSDEYGGSLGNRTRLLREIVDETKEAVGRTCAVAVRFSSDELLEVPGESLASEAHEIVALLAEVPDLWDVKSADWVGGCQGDWMLAPVVGVWMCDSGEEVPSVTCEPC